MSLVYCCCCLLQWFQSCLWIGRLMWACLFVCMLQVPVTSVDSVNAHCTTCKTYFQYTKRQFSADKFNSIGCYWRGHFFVVHTNKHKQIVFQFLKTKSRHFVNNKISRKMEQTIYFFLSKNSHLNEFQAFKMHKTNRIFLLLNDLILKVGLFIKNIAEYMKDIVFFIYEQIIRNTNQVWKPGEIR